MVNRMFGPMPRNIIAADVVQGIIVVGLLAFFTANHVTRPSGSFHLVPEMAGGIIQSFFIGWALALITMDLILDDEIGVVRITANGWSTIRQ
jgi:hypothetical protein